MQVIVAKGCWRQGLMPFHRTVKGLTKELRTLLHARCQRNEPFGTDQAEFVAHGLVQEDRRTHRIWDGPDELWVQEVDTHPSCGIPDASHRRKVAVVDSLDRILILDQRRAHAFEFCCKFRGS